MHRSPAGMLLLFAVALLATSSALAGSTTAAASVPDASVSGAAADGEVDVVPEPPGIPTVPVDLSEVAGHAAWLVEQYPGLLGGSWYDSSTNEVMVSVVTDVGLSLVASELPGGSVHAVETRVSLSQRLEDVHDVLMSSPDIRAVSVDQKSGDLFVIALDAAPAVIRAIDSATTSDVDVLVDTAAMPVPSESRDLDSSPYAGGFRYGLAPAGGAITGRCSGGFGYAIGSTSYMLTAGHCWPKGTTRTEAWTYSGSYVKQQRAAVFGNQTSVDSSGDDSIKFSDGEYHGDLALINVSVVDRNSGNRMWVGSPTSTTKIDVANRLAPYVGQNVCTSGATTGVICGYTITDVNTSWRYKDSCLLCTIESGDRADGPVGGCVQGGDSGGAVYVPIGNGQVRAVGVVDGRDDGGSPCDLLFTGVEEAVQAWGGELKFAP